MKFLLLLTLLSLLSLIFTFQAKTQSFLKEADDELDVDDSKFNEYESQNTSELEKEDTFDKSDSDEVNPLSSNENEFDVQALQNEIHHDIGSEKVSYKFDD
jgi:hypothetical protein